MDNTQRTKGELQSSVYNTLNKLKEVTQLSSDLNKLSECEIELITALNNFNRKPEGITNDK